MFTAATPFAPCVAKSEPFTVAQPTVAVLPLALLPGRLLKSSGLVAKPMRGLFPASPSGSTVPAPVRAAKFTVLQGFCAPSRV